MPTYLVTARKIKPKFRNAFRVYGLNKFSTVDVIERTWVVEQRNEAGVEHFFQCAKAEEMSAVRGFEIISIEQID